ncbi:phosphatidylserine decarboxylase [Flavisolibacter nicotianae]|uniref:phosphatidylserine decarboxylase n=1 Tax=Flavisolibacter nicotianae TaxID=2364882 RepID=UPI000EB38EF2|nr:phosphatidylserine decarboxylase [Flavisolibacter nicotianae]
MAEQQKIVKKLIDLLQADPVLKDALQTSLEKAAWPGLGSLEAFYSYLNAILTHIPREKELMPTVREFYFVISHSPGQLLKKNEAFNDWMNEFVRTRGDFMDTTASAETLPDFINNPDYRIEDYVKGPSGWLTYNQFLARQIKPGKRPIAGLCDDRVIVSPTDSEYKGQWTIDESLSVTAKGTTYAVADLLGDSAYKEVFKGGLLTHSFLSVSDYHRYHVPVSGRVVEIRKIPGRTWITEARKPDGTLENIDDLGFQFTHTRGCLVLDSAVGYIALIPVGMGHISSVNFIVDEGAVLTKGDEVGYFAFGGSDFILLFQAGKIVLTAEEKKYRQGEEIGHAK